MSSASCDSRGERNGSAPGFYGLPKIHKPGVPLRPIVDFTSPLRALSSFLHKTLAPLVGNAPTYVKNSSHFVQLLSPVSVCEDECLVSFDVVSLFTSSRSAGDDHSAGGTRA
ncbi:hypothetical protein HPB50_010541 [Hyalomma asiaticum]|uniref:Uncharacterized protein n=1 Tax=Hyalomma asiaticum TaxID=266040 RepID=A0ACB7T730_HYAAI|nr:hypothetical protein HPB50_010541 [Hyalomma asiaticum]